MSEKRFIFELVEISDVDNDKLVEVITDKEKNYSYGELDEVVFVLNEQQATISQLQDLCGESDGENAKLRIENKRLQEENEQLKQEIIIQLKVQDRILKEVRE